MAVRLLFFAQSSRWAGRREAVAEILKPVTLEEFWGRQELRSLKKYQDVIRLAVNREFADEKVLIKDGDEVAFLPPMSGG